MNEKMVGLLSFSVGGAILMLTLLNAIAIGNHYIEIFSPPYYPINPQIIIIVMSLIGFLLFGYGLTRIISPGKHT